jgi:hypothetical protein
MVQCERSRKVRWLNECIYLSSDSLSSS